MKFNSLRHLALPISIVLAFASGCSREEAPPPPIAVEAAPTSLEGAFKGASGEVKTLADDAISALHGKDYTKALFALQSLSGRSDVTGDQRALITRSMLSVHKALEEQAGTGDPQAQQALQLRRATK